MGVGASLRGVELTLDGRLVNESGEVKLRMDGTGETIRLSPLLKKVQWNKSRKRARMPTAAERSAYSRLKEEALGAAVTITGPLSAPKEGEPYTLEVRQFRASGADAAAQ